MSVTEKIKEENKKVELTQEVIGILKDMYPINFHDIDRLLTSIDYNEESLLSGTRIINIWFKNIQFGIALNDINKEYEIDYIYRDETGYASIDFKHRVKNMKISFNFRWVE